MVERTFFVDWLSLLEFAKIWSHKRSSKPFCEDNLRLMRSLGQAWAVFGSNSSYQSSYNEQRQRESDVGQANIHVTSNVLTAGSVEADFAKMEVIEVFCVQLIMQFLFLSGSFATSPCM